LFTVALKRNRTGAPADEVASTRAAVAPILIAPITTPKLAIDQAGRIGSGAMWKIAYSNLPDATKLGGSDILIEFIPPFGERSSTPTSLVAINSQPLKIRSPNGGTITTRRSGVGTLEVSTDFPLEGAKIRLVGRDPLDRRGEVTLIWP
jgi:hypothetical protein